MKGKKWRDVRNSLVMVIVMVAMMSSATFAWFTLTNSPTVAGLQMTAAASAGLRVSNTTNSGDFKNAILIKNDNANDADDDAGTFLKLTPVSTSTTGFCEPKYAGGAVVGLKNDPKFLGADLVNKVAVYEYYIKADGDESVGVGIITGNPSQTAEPEVTNDTASASGTFVRGSDDNAVTNAALAVRIGIIATSTMGTNVAQSDFANMIVFEPNSDGTLSPAGTAAPVITGQDGFQNKPSIAEKIKASTTGNIMEENGVAVSAPDKYTSNKLFEVNSDGKKVYMYVWLEGTDAQCVDEIRLDDIEAQIQFTIVE